MRVAKAASLALMLQERAEPSLLFLKALMAMILQILRTGSKQKTFQTINYSSIWVTKMNRIKALYNLARTSVSAHKSGGPLVLCAPCLEGRARSGAQGRHDQTPGSDRSNPRPTATDWTPDANKTSIKEKPSHKNPNNSRTSKQTNLWWVKRPEAYSNSRNSLRLEPKLQKHR